MLLRLLIIMSVLSPLTWTQIGAFIATIGLVTVIGAPLTFLILLLPTLTLCMWILYGSKAISGSYIPGILVTAALAAVPPFLLSPWITSQVRLHQADDTGIPELAADGILAIPSRNGEINNSVFAPLVLGFDGVIMVPPQEAKDRSPQLVTLKLSDDGKFCEPLQLRVKVNKNQRFPLLLNFGQEVALECATVRNATQEEADVIEQVEITRAPGPILGRTMQITRLTYQKRASGDLTEIARATWGRYQQAAWPLFTQIEPDGISIITSPGLYSARAMLAPEPVTAQAGGYVLTDVNREFPN